MSGENIVKFGDWISGGWNLFKQEWKTWSLMGAIFFLPVLIIIIAAAIGILLLSARGKPDAAFVTGMIAVLFLMMAGILVYVSYVTGGLYLTAFKQIRGEKIGVSDIWSGGAFTLKILGASIIITFLTLIGAIMCYFPAFVVGGWLYFTLPLIVKKGLGVFDAMGRSFDLTKKGWFMFTLFAFVVGMISQIGVYACYVGIVFTLPLLYTISAVAYTDCFEGGYHPEGQEVQGGTPSRHCSSCGKPIPADANFCGHCGSGQR